MNLVAVAVLREVATEHLTRLFLFTDSVITVEKPSVRSVSLDEGDLKLFGRGHDDESERRVVRFVIRNISSPFAPSIVHLKMKVRVYVVSYERMEKETVQWDGKKRRPPSRVIAVEDSTVLKA